MPAPLPERVDGPGENGRAGYNSRDKTAFVQWL